MKTYINFAAAAIMLIAACVSGFSQETPDSAQWRIETRDQNVFTGTIVLENDAEIHLQTEQMGVITLKKTMIRSMERIDATRIVRGEYWAENPQSTRYFWAPNGYGLRRGESYYQNVWIFFNQYSTAITDNTSIGFGIVPMFLFAGAASPIWITPKVSMPVVKDQFNVGAGALIGTVIGEETGFFGIAYGVGTIGNRDQNLNIGLGYGFAGGEWANVPTVTVSGMIRVGPKGYIISENYFIDAGGSTLGLLSLGGRTVLRRISIDYGAFIPVAGDINIIFAVPWLGLSVPLGRRK